jgi:hypothetical protein
MSEKNPNDKNDQNPPLDDYGIDHDRLLEICEKIIEITHKRYVEDNHIPKNAAELRDVAETLDKVWSLTSSILDLDDFLRSAMQALATGKGLPGELPEGFADFDIEDLEDDMDDEDDEEDE